MRKLLLAGLLLASGCPASFAQIRPVAAPQAALPTYQAPPAPLAGSYRFRLDSLPNRIYPRKPAAPKTA